MRNYQETVTKSDGNGNIFEVPNPDLYNDEGRRIKHRKPTNFTPKKKKRK
jgi:hypothetical protein